MKRFLPVSTRSVEGFRGKLNITKLGDIEDERNSEEYPPLSVIVPARIEERTVAESTESALAQD